MKKALCLLLAFVLAFSYSITALAEGLSYNKSNCTAYFTTSSYAGLAGITHYFISLNDYCSAADYGSYIYDYHYSAVYSVHDGILISGYYLVGEGNPRTTVYITSGYNTQYQVRLRIFNAYYLEGISSSINMYTSGNFTSTTQTFADK